MKHLKWAFSSFVIRFILWGRDEASLAVFIHCSVGILGFSHSCVTKSGKLQYFNNVLFIFNPRKDQESDQHYMHERIRDVEGAGPSSYRSESDVIISGLSDGPASNLQ